MNKNRGGHMWRFWPVVAVTLLGSGRDMRAELRVLDFESLAPGFYREMDFNALMDGVKFHSPVATARSGFFVRSIVSPPARVPLFGRNSIQNNVGPGEDDTSMFIPYIQATFRAPTRYVRVTMGDQPGDTDRLHLLAFDANDNLIGNDFSMITSVDTPEEQDFVLEVSAPGIAYVRFYGMHSADSTSNTVLWDNFAWEPQGLPISKLATFAGGQWFLDRNGNRRWDGVFIDRTFTFTFNDPAEVPLRGDWNGSGSSKIGVFVRGAWLLDYNGNGVWDGASYDKLAFFGNPASVPVVGDWNDSGSTKIGVFQDGTWRLDFNGNLRWDGEGVDRTGTLGTAGYTPVVGDWSGSGSDKIGAFRAGLWLLDMDGDFTYEGPAIDKQAFLGFAGSIPVVGDWSGSGPSKIGVFQNGLWLLDLNGNFLWDGAAVDQTFLFGGADSIPVVGNWLGLRRTEVGVFKDGVWLLDLNGNFRYDPPTEATVFGGSLQTPVPDAW